MAKKTNANVVQLRDYATKPRIENFTHKELIVPEWDDNAILCRAMSAGDWYDYQQLAKELAVQKHAEFDEEEQAVQDELITKVNPIELYAFVFVRCVHDPASKERIFTDKDRPAIVASFSPVHDRIVADIFSLSRLEAGNEPKNA